MLGTQWAKHKEECDFCSAFDPPVPNEEGKIHLKARCPNESCNIPSSIPVYSLVLSSIRELGLTKTSEKNSNFMFSVKLMSLFTMSWQVPILHHLTLQTAPIGENVNCCNLGNIFFSFSKLLVSVNGFHFLETFIFSVQETKFWYPFSPKWHFRSAKVSSLKAAGFFCIWQLMIIYFQLLASNITASCSNIWLHLEQGVHALFLCP